MEKVPPRGEIRVRCITTADAFGNALGNAIVREMRASDLEKARARAEQERQIREQYGFVDWDSIGSISPGQFSNDMAEYAWKKSDEQRALDLSEKMAFFRATDTANGLDPLTTRADYDLPDTFRGSRAEAYLGQAYSGIANLLENGSLNDPGATGRALVGGEIGALYGNLVDGSNRVSWWNSSSGDALRAYYELGAGRGPVAAAGEQTHLLVFSEAASHEARKLMVTDYVGANVPADELAGYYMAIDDGAAVVDVTAGWYMSASKSLEGYSDTFYSRAFMDTNNLLSENMFGRVLELGGKHVGNAVLGLFEPAFKGGYFAGDEYAPRAFRQKAAWTLGAEAVASTLAIGELFWAARASKAGDLGSLMREKVTANIAKSQQTRETRKWNLNPHSQYGPGERALTKEQYKMLMSNYRGAGDQLHDSLDFNLSQQDYVYRAMKSKDLHWYREAGRINRPAYTTTDFVGLDPRELMNRSQVFDQWGEPDILLKIPVSELVNPVVPRPLGGALDFGWEPFTEAYPAAGKGGILQFLTETKSWDDSWVIPLSSNGN